MGPNIFAPVCWSSFLRWAGDAIRAQGVSDEEIIEVISLAALGNYLDTLADALKVPVDSVFRDALGG